VTVGERRPNRTLGPLHDEFWSFCARDEFRLLRCRRCLHFAWPPRPECERCGAQDLAWEEVSGRGNVVSWCRLQQPYYDELSTPWDVILVELEEGPLFVTNPRGFETIDVQARMLVRVAFVDCEDDAGPFRLPVFERS
jgi:uncharacterized protein